MSGDTEQNVLKCACGGEPQFMELCEAFSFGRAGAISLNGGKPVCFRIACPRCGFTTADHKTGEGAIDEWNIHASENSHETPSDISKRLRDWADRLPEEEPFAWFERPVEKMQEILRDIADKIDAAWKRDRDAITAEKEHFRLYGLAEHAKVLALKSSSVGNSSAMREALKLCIKEMCMYCRNEMIARGLESTCVFGCETLNIARSALDAPMRNCEKYDCKTDAEVGFVEDTGETDTNPLYWQLFANWLFSSATNEGGAK